MYRNIEHAFVWDLISCSLLNIYRCFGRTCCFRICCRVYGLARGHLECRTNYTLKTQRAGSTESSRSNYMWRRTSEESKPGQPLILCKNVIFKVSFERIINDVFIFYFILFFFCRKFEPPVIWKILRPKNDLRAAAFFVQRL